MNTVFGEQAGLDEMRMIQLFDRLKEGAKASSINLEETSMYQELVHFLDELVYH